jgi:uncharacterized protein (TIGR04222 family)
MLVTTTAGTWGITGEQFLWGYGLLCVAAAIGVWRAYRQALGPPAGPTDPLPDLSIGEIGMLSGGPGCAITAATARLYHDGLVNGTTGTLAATGELDATADPIEREVFETVTREPWLSVGQILERVRDSATMRTLSEQMTRAGLLLDGPQARRVHLLWIAPALLTAIGVLRVLAGVANDQAVLVLFAMTGAAGLATARLVALRPVATRRGQDILERLRGERESLLRQPAASQSALTAALFGAGALWLAEPAIASALGVPREEDLSTGTSGTSGGGGGGGCGGGCGGGGCGG